MATQNPGGFGTTDSGTQDASNAGDSMLAAMPSDVAPPSSEASESSEDGGMVELASFHLYIHTFTYIYIYIYVVHCYTSQRHAP